MKNYFVFSLFMLLSAFSAYAQKGLVLDSSKEKVLVVAHRADWRNFPENSLEGIMSCIRMGVDMVEIDVMLTKDKQLVLMHDKTLERTTNGKGKVADFTLEEIQQLRLKDGLSFLTHYKIPTLEEALLTVKDQVLINVDKADNCFGEVYELLEKTGTINQAVIKSTLPYDTLLAKYGPNLKKMIFMPIVRIGEETTIDELQRVLEEAHVAYELVFPKEQKALLLQIKEKLEPTSSLIWVNTLWPSLCDQYYDNRAIDEPEETYGYLIDTLGVNMIQTDRPQYLIDYLTKRGLHK